MIKNYKVGFSVVTPEFHQKSFVFDVWASSYEAVVNHVNHMYGKFGQIENLTITETASVMLAEK